MIDLNSPEIKFILDAVWQSAMLVQRVQAELVSSSLTKDDRSPVTVADFASQALIGKLLEDAFPDDAMVAEEESSAVPGSITIGSILRPASGRWILLTAQKASCAATSMWLPWL